MEIGDFPGSPAVKTPRFQCRGRRLDPGRETKIPRAVRCAKKKKKKNVELDNKQENKQDVGGWVVSPQNLCPARSSECGLIWK